MGIYITIPEILQEITNHFHDDTPTQATSWISEELRTVTQPLIFAKIMIILIDDWDDTSQSYHERCKRFNEVLTSLRISRN